MNFVAVFVEPEAGETEKVQVQGAGVEAQQLVGFYVERTDVLVITDND